PREQAAAARHGRHVPAGHSDAKRPTFNTATPNRSAFKHAHSQQNPEQDWGKNVLRSIKFAFSVLNDKFRDRHVKIDKRNTIVIASSVSNGGGASVPPLEQDDDHPIHGRASRGPTPNPNFP